MYINVFLWSAPTADSHTPIHFRHTHICTNYAPFFRENSSAMHLWYLVDSGPIPPEVDPDIDPKMWLITCNSCAKKYPTNFLYRTILLTA